jgi:hypothetical protein
MVITFAYELGLRYFLFEIGRGSNSTSKAPNSEPGWCFKFHAKNYGISIGHTFYSIELKIGVLPI